MELTSELSAEQIAQELLAVLPRWNRLVSRELRSEAGNDSTMVQLRVLAALSEGTLTLSALARKREVSLQAASEQVQSLVVRGWVERVPDMTDRRQSLLMLTDEGARQLAQVREHIASHLSPMIERLTDDDINAIHAGLQALRRALATEEALPE